MNYVDILKGEAAFTFTNRPMSALDSYITNRQDSQPILSQSAYKKVFAKILWEIFDLEKDVSIRISIFRIPISIKIEKLSPLIEYLVGPRE